MTTTVAAVESAWEAAPPWQSASRQYAPLDSHRRCDAVVIGGGLAGLSTALHLVELDPDREVIVLEASRLGAGASGRGTGLLGTRVGPPLRVARRRYGDDAARAMYASSETAVQCVLDLCRRYHIDCQLTRGTQLMVASNSETEREMELEYQAAQALGINIDAVDGHALPTRTGQYRGGLRYPLAATLNPAALTSQLADLVEQRGVRIFENSAVRRIDRGAGIRVVTDRGSVTTDQVVFALNAYASPLGPAGVVGMRVQAAATVPLTERQLAAVAWLRTESLIEIGHLPPYYRLTPDHRLIVGGGGIRRGVDGSNALAAGYLSSAVGLLDPDLIGLELSHAWSGPIGLTLDGLPIVGDIAEGAFAAAGWCGHGVAMATYAGALLAARIVTGHQPDRMEPWLRRKARRVPTTGPAAHALDRYLARYSERELNALGNRVFRQFLQGKAANPTAGRVNTRR